MSRTEVTVPFNEIKNSYSVVVKLCDILQHQSKEFRFITM